MIRGVLERANARRGAATDARCAADAGCAANAHRAADAGLVEGPGIRGSRGPRADRARAVSAHSASHGRGWLSALVAQVCDYVFEEVEEAIEPPKDLVAQPVIAVVAAAPRSGASTV